MQREQSARTRSHKHVGGSQDTRPGRTHPCGQIILQPCKQADATRAEKQAAHTDTYLDGCLGVLANFIFVAEFSDKFVEGERSIIKDRRELAGTTPLTSVSNSSGATLSA